MGRKPRKSKSDLYLPLGAQCEVVFFLREEGGSRMGYSRQLASVMGTWWIHKTKDMLVERATRNLETLLAEDGDELRRKYSAYTVYFCREYPHCEPILTATL